MKVFFEIVSKPSAYLLKNKTPYSSEELDRLISFYSHSVTTTVRHIGVPRTQILPPSKICFVGLGFKFRPDRKRSYFISPIPGVFLDLPLLGDERELTGKTEEEVYMVLKNTSSVPFTLKAGPSYFILTSEYKRPFKIELEKPEKRT